MTQIHDFLNTFKIMIKNDEFDYIDSYQYKNTLLKIFDDFIYLNNLNKPDKYIEDELFSTYTYNEKLILDIIGNLFESKNGYENFDLNNTNDIEYIETYLNKISLNINEKNSVKNQNLILPVASTSDNIDNNYKKIIIANDRRINNYAILKQQQRRLESEEKFLYQNNINRKDKIIQNHDMTMNMLINKDLKIWKDPNNKLYYRPKAFEEKQKVTKSDISDVIKNILGFYVNIYDNVESVTIIDSNYLIISLLPVVKNEVFNPFSADEFIFITNNLYYRNTFECTELLKKRFYPKHIDNLEDNIKYLESRNPYYYNNLYNEIDEKKEELRTISNLLHVKDYSFIFNFLKLIFKNENEFYYFLNWLTNFFYYFKKSNIVIVLIGDNETTDFLINSIIKPIFIKYKKYISVITNDVLKNEKDFDKLLENKVLYHINNLDDKTDIKRVDKIIKEFVKPNYSTDYESFIYGELLVTSSKDSPYLYLKNVLSCCTILRIKDMEAVLNSLNIDYSAFERNIFNDLDNFTNILLQNSKNNNYIGVLETDEKTYLKNMKKGVLVTPKIDQKIDYFVKNILTKNISSFKNIKNHDEDIYEELIYNFNENKIAQPMLNKYFNMIYNEVLIPENNEFIKILQNKAKMFNDTPSDDSKYNGKKRYEIYQ